MGGSRYFPGEFVPGPSGPVEPLATEAEFEQAAEDPEFNSVDPTVVSEGPHGFLLSDGTFTPKTDEPAVAENGKIGFWGQVASGLLRFVWCK